MYIYSIYIYMYIYIYIYIYIISSSRKPSGHLFMVSVVDIIQRFCFYGFRRRLFNGFRRGRKTFFFFMVSIAGLLVDSAAAGGSIILECIERFLVFLFVFRTGFHRGFLMVSVVARNLFVYGFRRWFLLWFPAATGPRLSLRWKP